MPGEILVYRQPALTGRRESWPLSREVDFYLVGLPTLELPEGA
jgi:hypothetical protein